jgi:pre-mRNA-splicing factor CWC26
MSTTRDSTEKHSEVIIDPVTGKKLRKVKRRKVVNTTAKIIDEDADTTVWSNNTEDSSILARSDAPFDIPNQLDDEDAPVVVEIKGKLPSEKPGWKPIGEAAQPTKQEQEQTGLQTLEELRRHNEKLKAERLEALRRMDPKSSGRDAETVYRDERGRRIDLAAERAEKAAKRRAEEERLAREMEWGKGRVQRQAEQIQRQLEEEIAKQPFARYADDPEWNEELKRRERWDDPAAGFLTKKSRRGPKMPTYQGPPPPPNRFNIPPGYRWDGVDRSNGFEKALFARRAAKTTTAAEAYKWSVEDM